MTNRKRDDAEGWKRGQGAYSKAFNIPEGKLPGRDPGTSPRGVGAYTEDNSGLRNKMPDEDPEQGKYTLAGDAKDIWDAVEGQSSDSGNRAVRSGRRD